MTKTANEMCGAETRRRAGLIRISWIASALAVFFGCAPTQPEPIVVFVDGEPLQELPPSVELTADRDHTLFFQREGYRSQLIIVRTVQREGEDRLEPEHVELRLKRVTDTAPSVTVELEEAP
ncbi:MAG: hypothetical protein JRG89_04160 [Deltaproteobacteria bacterium]|nr:hypothetical protein [Deltaproteobacteria bacterium]